jgi:hypothetical protein
MIFRIAASVVHGVGAVPGKTCEPLKRNREPTDAPLLRRNLTRVRAGDSPARGGESEQVQAFTVGEV